MFQSRRLGPGKTMSRGGAAEADGQMGAKPIHCVKETTWGAHVYLLAQCMFLLVEHAVEDTGEHDDSTAQEVEDMSDIKEKRRDI